MMHPDSEPAGIGGESSPASLKTTNASGATWLIVEPHFDGHHFVYLERIVRGALERNIRVIVGVGDEAQGQRTAEGLRRSFGDGRVNVVSRPLPPLSRLRFGALRLAQDEMRRQRFLKHIFAMAEEQFGAIDYVLLPYLDWSLFAISVMGTPFGDTPFSGITMRQRFHFKAAGVVALDDPMNGIKGVLFRKLLRLRALRHVFAIDESLGEVLRKARTEGAEKILYVPDPTDPPVRVPRAEARRKLAIREDACVVLVFGFLDARKGVQRLLEWMGSDAAPSCAHLVAVGRQDADAENLFAAPAAQRLAAEGRLHVVNGFVSDEAADEYFSAADLVWLGYENFEMMSSVLVKAAVHHRSVIHSPVGLIGMLAERYGSVVNPSPCCGSLLRGLPAGLHVRSFRPEDGALAFPDHSWTNAVRLFCS